MDKRDRDYLVEAIAYLLGVFIPWTAKTFLYHYGFRWRHIHATIQTKIIVAGAPMIVRAFVPFPLSGFLFFLIAVGVALYLCRKFTDGKLYPDLVLVVGGAEIVGFILIDSWLMPIIL